LRTESGNHEAAEELSQTSRRRADQEARGDSRASDSMTRGLERNEDYLRFHYLVSYTPTNMSFDGRYRTIAVKVARPGVTVQTRKGYYAVRPEYAVPVRGYDAPALALLDRSPRPEALAIRMGALGFTENE